MINSNKFDIFENIAAGKELSLRNYLLAIFPQFIEYFDNFNNTENIKPEDMLNLSKNKISSLLSYANDPEMVLKYESLCRLLEQSKEQNPNGTGKSGESNKFQTMKYDNMVKQLEEKLAEISGKNNYITNIINALYSFPDEKISAASVKLSKLKFPVGDKYLGIFNMEKNGFEQESLDDHYSLSYLDSIADSNMGKRELLKNKIRFEKNYESSLLVDNERRESRFESLTNLLNGLEISFDCLEESQDDVNRVQDFFAGFKDYAKNILNENKDKYFHSEEELKAIMLEHKTIIDKYKAMKPNDYFEELYKQFAEYKMVPDANIKLA